VVYRKYAPDPSVAFGDANKGKLLSSGIDFCITRGSSLLIKKRGL
jgi:hypothetical protein